MLEVREISVLFAISKITPPFHLFTGFIEPTAFYVLKRFAQKLAKCTKMVTLKCLIYIRFTK